MKCEWMNEWMSTIFIRVDQWAKWKVKSFILRFDYAWGVQKHTPYANLHIHAQCWSWSVTSALTYSVNQHWIYLFDSRITNKSLFCTQNECVPPNSIVWNNRMCHSISPCFFFSLVSLCYFKWIAITRISLKLNEILYQHTGHHIPEKSINLWNDTDDHDNESDECPI